MAEPISESTQWFIFVDRVVERLTRNAAQKVFISDLLGTVHGSEGNEGPQTVNRCFSRFNQHDKRGRRTIPDVNT